jgi:cell division septation protein DedD
VLRVVVALLLLANLAFFAWTRGWLDPTFPAPTHGQREPERLAAQVRSETVTVLAPSAASEALAAAAAASAAAKRVCLVAGPFADAEIAAAEAAMSAASLPAGSWSREQAQAAGPGWAVYIGRFPDRELMRARADELRRLGFRVEEAAGAGLVPGLVLGRHDAREAADAALAEAQAKGLRTARVIELPPPPARHYLRASAADPELQAQLAGLKGGAIRDGFGPCPTP